MLDKVDRSVRTRVTALVDQMLPPDRPRPAPGADAALGALGLTSFDLVNLMLAVESEFDVTIPPADITPDNFRSLATVEALLARLGVA